MGVFEIYKPGQGKHTRIATFVTVMVIGIAGAVVLSDKLSAYFGPYLRFGIPVVLVVALGVLMFWLVNRPKSADFLCIIMSHSTAAATSGSQYTP